MTKLIAGLDIGNGYVKGKVKSETVTNIDIASGVAYVTNTHDIKTPDAELPEFMPEIFDRMDVSFETPLVPDRNRRLFGKRGLQSGMSIEEFDVYSDALSIRLAELERTYRL